MFLFWTSAALYLLFSHRNLGSDRGKWQGVALWKRNAMRQGDCREAVLDRKEEARQGITSKCTTYAIPSVLGSGQDQSNFMQLQEIYMMNLQ